MTPPDFVHDSSPLFTLPPRRADSHKGDYGRAVLIGGSIGMNGAIALAGMAALRGGAGLVRLGVPAACHSIVAGFNPSFMVTPLASAADGSLDAKARDQIAALTEPATAVGCGPGLTTSDGVRALVPGLYQSLEQPAVFDADALNVLARQPDVLARPGGPRILTPHPGEFARLLGTDRQITATDRETTAAAFARDHRVVVVLKGHETVITDGKRLAINPTGNPGMATGGTGDVLTGLIVALLCQHADPYQAARLAVYLHGLAGDLAAADLGQISLAASDLIDALPRAFKHHQSKTDGLANLI